MNTVSKLGVALAAGFALTAAWKAADETTPEDAQKICDSYARNNTEQIQGYINAADSGEYTLRSNNPLPLVENVSCTFGNDDQGRVVLLDSSVLVND